MFTKFYKFFFVIFCLSSFRTSFVNSQCPFCGFRAAYWLRNELAELNCAPCEATSLDVKIFIDIDLLVNKTSSMFKNGKLYLYGTVGDTGAFGAQGSTGNTGPPGVMGPMGRPGSTGATGHTGSTGPFGPQGRPGGSRFKRQTNSVSGETVRKKISAFLSNCSEVSDYFLSFADQIEDKKRRKSNKAKPNWTKKIESESESESLKNFIARYEQVSRLYERVQTLFNDVRKEVESDLRYKGSTGSTGGTGSTGSAGRTGLNGPVGNPGIHGTTGYNGAPGVVGLVGNTGPSGGN